MPAPSPTDRIVILHGPELFLLHEYTRQLRDALAQLHGQVDTIRFDGITASLADVLDECRSFGLMPTHKLIVIDTAEQLVKEDNRPAMERYAQSPSDSATLLLRAGERWSTGTKFDALVAKVGSVIKCESPNDDHAAAWIVQRARKRHACEVEPASAMAMVERLGSDLARLDTEIAKLAAAAAPSKTITPDLVRDLVGRTREEDMWSIKRTLVTQRPEDAVRELRLILDNSRKDAHTPVGYACMDATRALHAGGCLLRQGVPGEAVANKLRFWGAEKYPMLEAAKRLDPAKAAALFLAAVDADVRQKTGLGDSERTLEMLTLRIASEVAGSSDKR